MYGLDNMATVVADYVMSDNNDSTLVRYMFGR